MFYSISHQGIFTTNILRNRYKTSVPLLPVQLFLKFCRYKIRMYYLQLVYFLAFLSVAIPCALANTENLRFILQGLESSSKHSPTSIKELLGKSNADNVIPSIEKIPSLSLRITPANQKDGAAAIPEADPYDLPNKIFYNSTLIEASSSSTLSESETVVPHDRLIESIRPSFSHQISRSYLVTGKINEMYEVRVCWPASFPTRFNLYFTQNFNNGSGIITVVATPDYYSNYRELMESPLPGQFEVIINKVYFNALPKDILGAVGLVAVAGFVAFLFSNSVASYISV